MSRAGRDAFITMTINNSWPHTSVQSSAIRLACVESEGLCCKPLVTLFTLPAQQVTQYTEAATEDRASQSDLGTRTHKLLGLGDFPNLNIDGYFGKIKHELVVTTLENLLFTDNEMLECLMLTTLLTKMNPFHIFCIKRKRWKPLKEDIEKLCQKRRS